MKLLDKTCIMFEGWLLLPPLYVKGADVNGSLDSSLLDDEILAWSLHPTYVNPEVKNHVTGLIALSRYMKENLVAFVSDIPIYTMAKVFLAAPGRTDQDYYKEDYPGWFVNERYSWMWPPKS